MAKTKKRVLSLVLSLAMLLTLLPATALAITQEGGQYEEGGTIEYHVTDKDLEKILATNGYQPDSSVEEVSLRFTEDINIAQGDSFNMSHWDTWGGYYTYSFSNLSRVQPKYIKELVVTLDGGESITIPADELTCRYIGTASHIYELSLSNPVDLCYVTFYVQEGNALHYTKYSVVSVEKGQALGENMPADPDVGAYRFLYWEQGTSDGTGPVFTKDTPVTSDIDVYARKVTVGGGSAYHVINTENVFNAYIAEEENLTGPVVIDKISVIGQDGTLTNPDYFTNSWKEYEGTPYYYVYNVDAFLPDWPAFDSYRNTSVPAEEMTGIKIYYSCDGVTYDIVIPVEKLDRKVLDGVGADVIVEIYLKQEVTSPIEVTPVLTAEDKTYDGNTSVKCTLSLTGVTPGDDVRAVAASVAFADEDAGYNKTVTATGITLQGADAHKYELTTDTATTTADIFQKTLTVTITPTDRVFNGSNEVEVTISGVGEDGKTPVDVIANDDAYLKPIPTTGTMDTADVGDGKKVEVRGPMLVGNDRNNYALIVNVDTVNIYPVDTNVVTVTGYTGMYNGQPQGVTASASLEGSTLLYSTDDGDNKTWSEAAPTFTNAGTYTVYVKATKANAADSPVASAQVVIGQRDVVLTSGSSSKTYDGLPLVNPNVTVSGSGFVAGEGAVYAVTGSQTSVGSSQNLFTYTLNAGTVATNYTITVRYGTLTVSNYIPPYIPPVDPGTDIEDPDVPLADLPGLNTKDHYAYIAGYPDGTVQPNGNITRAEVATIFFRLFTEEYRNTYWSVSAPFADVEATDWFNTEVATVASAGVVNGYPDGTFLPNNNITRAEFATIAARFLTEEYVGPDLFTDVSGHWAQEYINRAANAGWINGYPDGSFHPDAYITRAEAMTLVNNMLGRMPHEDHLLAGMKLWVDNPSTMWYYEAVQEATNGHDYDWAEDNSYEIWTSLTPDPDWEALEALWTSQNA